MKIGLMNILNLWGGEHVRISQHRFINTFIPVACSMNFLLKNYSHIIPITVFFFGHPIISFTPLKWKTLRILHLTISNFTQTVITFGFTHNPTLFFILYIYKGLRNYPSNSFIHFLKLCVFPPMKFFMGQREYWHILNSIQSITLLLL